MQNIPFSYPGAVRNIYRETNIPGSSSVNAGTGYNGKEARGKGAGGQRKKYSRK